MFKQAEIDGCDGKNCTNENYLHVGDHVNYKPTEGKKTGNITKQETGYEVEQSYTVDTSVQWRVLGLNEDKTQVILISATPIKSDDSENPHFICGGPEAYYYGQKTLNRICEIYKNDDLSSSAKSIDIDTINRLIGITVETDKVYKTNIDTSSTGSLGLGKTYSYRSGDYTPENYVSDVFGVEIDRKKVGDKVVQTGYMYDYLNSSVIDQESALFDVLFADILGHTGS